MVVLHGQKLCIAVACGGGLIRGVFVGFSTVFVGNGDDEISEFGFRVEVSFTHHL